MDALTRRDFLQASGAGLGCSVADGGVAQDHAAAADLILTNGRFATLNQQRPTASAVAIKGGRFVAVSEDNDVMTHRGAKTKVVDLKQRTVIPGLNDSHTHLIRGGLSYNLELRWDGVPSLADALRMLKEQARRTPPPQWVRVVGGWSEFQFKERRMPTLQEMNAVAPDTPVFVLNLYDRAWLNKAALRAVGYTKDTPQPNGAEIQRDKQGNPTGLLIARPNASILYATLAKAPKLSPEDQINSTRLFMREMNRFGLTSCIDAGGGGHRYPEDYKVVTDLARQGELTIRIAYNLFTQRPKEELEDFTKWVKSAKAGEGDEFYRLNGAGEMLAYSAADFEDFLEPRPDGPPSMEADLTKVVTLLAKNRWPFRLHATYDNTITRALNVFEAVNKEAPLSGLRWFFDHAETISERNIERVKALAGGIAVQHRMAYQGEYFLNRYGKEATEQAPPVSRFLKMGVPVGMGTDATRVASYNPWVALYWLVAGKTVGGTTLYSESNRLDRMEALRRYTLGSAWFSGEEDKKGSIEVGRLADLAVLSADYFSVPEEEIKRIDSVLTVVGGKVVYAAGEFEKLSPPPLPVSPDWSPVKAYGGYQMARSADHPRKNNGLLHDEIACGVERPLECDCFAF
jgi:predicted amidohydrolase YtcJ